MDYTLRTRFKGEIVAEFVKPKRRSQKAIILLGGMPSVPSKNEVLFFLAKKGYWAFFPRYRGSWESGGRFLEESPEEDVLDVLDQLPKGFKNLWSGETEKPDLKEIFLIGSSFGGPAVLLGARDSRVKKAVAFSPVVDWREETEAEPMDWLAKFTKDAFGEGYRFSVRDWNKLKSGKFYSPIFEIESIPGGKVFIIHAKDDEVVDFKPVAEFAKKIKCEFLALSRGGHLSTSALLKPSIWRRVERFLEL